MTNAASSGALTAASSPRKPRPRRIAADEAHAWARNLRLRNPYAKLVISMLTLYVQGDGSCFVGVKALAEDCELAEETVRRRLGWLESIGAIARFPQWVDEAGRRNSDGRGKRTTDEIRLLVDADQDLIEMRACGEGDSNEDGGGISPVHGTGLNDDAATDDGGNDGTPSTSKNLAQPSISPLAAPSLRRGPDSFEPEPEPSPPTPPSGGVQGDGRESEEAPPAGWPHEESWQRFKTIFESDGDVIRRPEICRTLWEAYNDGERESAERAASGLIAWRSRQKKPPAKQSAQTFLREIETHARYVSFAPPPPPKPKPKSEIAAGSDEFKALALCAAIAGKPPFRADLDFVPVTGDVPHGASGLAALVRFKHGSYEVDQSGWTIAEEKTPRYVAWLERVSEWLGTWPPRNRYWLDENGNIVPSADQAAVKRQEGIPEKWWTRRCRDGLLMPPLEFPPPKGAGATGPPPNDPPSDEATATIKKTG